MTIESSVQPLTGEEFQEASEYLTKTRDELVEAIADLSETQWTFRSSPERWSVGDNVEHLGIVETLFLQNTAALFDQLSMWQPGRQRLLDRDVVSMGINRGIKISAPERLLPSGTMRPQAAVARFLVARERTRDFLASTPDLRERFREHPVVGAIDIYQWVLLVGAHTERHRLQILEIKGDSQFPKS
ncbi:MAG TPA: DinB family protein [Bryobacteraceae bacterium]|jgi:hypothetical protein|nr:DinB family protein [Bryobacteraceae bacterium]